ncbi:Uncharacterised protein [Vibrio cholerae]|nr:Uncharacterised protein [Vibrio cholerae]CSC99854.1 Uncharacterised protein [Vibrio cholerae]CSI52344.1 Uncharacterised protein [Vibrio cholerae]
MTLFGHVVDFLVETCPTRIIHKAKLTRFFGQTQISVVFTQQQTIFRTRSEHTVRFFSAHGRKIVDQHAHVRLIATWTPAFFVLAVQAGVQTRHQALRSGFFVTCSTVDLSCKEQTMDIFGFIRLLQITWIEEVVFNRVTRTNDMCVLKTFH